MEPSAPSAPNPAPGQQRWRLSEFFLMRERLAMAEQQLLGGSSERQAAFRHAEAALEAAADVEARSLDVSSASALLEEALYWAAFASGRPLSAPSVEADAWAKLEGDPELAALSAEDHRRIVELLRRRSPERTGADLALLRRAVDTVLRAPRTEARTVARVRMARRLRWIAALLIPVGIAVGVVAWRFEAARRKNVALHKPTETSSQGGSVKGTDGVVDGKTFGLGFQTASEARPWLRLDLKEERSIRQVTVYNGDHCCFERAVPLIIEVSSDGQRYQEVARRERPFGVWQADFATVQARYVRLTVDKTSIFHLSEVEVR